MVTFVFQERAYWIAGIGFFAAFVLTFWPGRVRSALAAALYGIAIIACLSVPAYFRFTSVRIAYSLSASYERFPPLGWLMPILFIGFGIAATALLWPSIPQQTAMRLGKILHLLVFPPVFLILLVAAFQAKGTASPYGVKWLVYALLWFRIRESYAARLTDAVNPDGSRNLEPAD